MRYRTGTIFESGFSTFRSSQWLSEADFKFCDDVDSSSDIKISYENESQKKSSQEMFNCFIRGTLFKFKEKFYAKSSHVVKQLIWLQRKN